MYIIRVIYTTSDSFTPPHETDWVLDIKWESLDAAKQALNDLKEHHLAYMDLDEYSFKRKTKTELNKLKKKYKKKPWYEKGHSGEQFSSFILNLADDNGVRHPVYVGYHGYFETFVSAQIENEEPEKDGMSFSANRIE